MDAVLFDMDGVLVNSEDYWHEHERETILPTAVPDDDVSVDEVTGVFYKEVYDLLDEQYDVAVDRDELLAMYEDVATDIYSEEVELTDGVRDLLETLRDRGVTVGMVTSSPPDWYGIVLDRFDLEGLFDTVVCAADLDAPGKPEPDIYEHAADELGIDPEATVVVEDSGNGREAARRAGMTVVGFGVGAAGDDLDDADEVAESPEELRDVLLSRA